MNERQPGLRLSLVLLISLLGSAASAGMTWGVTANRLAAGEDRDARMERRIDRLEEVTQRSAVLLERIDERTAEIKRVQDLRKNP